jgi:putative two-component system response regulator
MKDDILTRCLAAPILIVDDVEANVMLLTHIMQQRGYSNLRSTTDPNRVAALHQEHRFDLILLDLMMPKLDGMGVMQTLIADLEDDYLPVIMITAQTDIEARQRALEHGARDFITKPFQVMEVLQRISNHLEVRMLYHEREQEAVRLEQRVRERTRELEDTQVEILRRLAIAGEYRDNETGNHVLRVSQGCHLLALAAGLPTQEALTIFHASPMHDVGKIGIPDRILLKPGRLEGEELTIMRRHAEIGGRMLDDHSAPVMQMASRIAFCHHEKWDGSGYPEGKAGEAIPIEARIVAICDVFDALTSARPYKQPWALDDAVAYVRDEAGRHFDPRLVGCFMEILPQIFAIRAEHADREIEPGAGIGIGIGA